MKATTLIALQFIALVAMIATGCTIYRNNMMAIPFAVALMVYVRCSIYIEKHGKRLLREYNKKKSANQGKSAI